MGLKNKPKKIIYEFYDIDQNGKPGDSPLPFLGMLGPGRTLFDQGGALSGGRRESFRGGDRFNPMGKTAQQQNMRAGAAAGDQIDALTARDDMNTTLSSADFKDAMNNPSTTKTRGSLGFLGNKMARKRRADQERSGEVNNEPHWNPGIGGAIDAMEHFRNQHPHRKETKELKQLVVQQGLSIYQLSLPYQILVAGVYQKEIIN